MKAKQTSLFALALCAIGVGVASSQAQSLYWDTSGAAGVQGGDGTWNSSSFWNSASDGSGTPQGWTSGANANFTATDAASTIGLEGNSYTADNLLKGGTKNLTLQNGTLNVSGNITVSGGTAALGSVNLTGASGTQTILLTGGSGTTLSGTLNIGARNVHVDFTYVGSNDEYKFNAALNGSGNLIYDKTYQAGANRLSLNANNGSNWTGNFVVNNGGYAQLLSSTFFTKNNLLVFQANGGVGTRTSPTVGGLSGNTGRFLSEVNATLTIDTSTRGDASFGGNLVHFPNRPDILCNVVKKGSGTQTFSGANTYTGTTQVQGGTLLVNGTHTGGGAYTVANGAKLGGNGTIGAVVTLNSGATLAPGASPGVLTVSDLTLQDGAIVEFEAGDRTDTTTLAIGTSTGAWDLNLRGTTTQWALGGYTVLFTYDPTLGSFTGTGAWDNTINIKDPDGLLAALGTTAGNLSITDTGTGEIRLNGIYVIPEAETSTLLLGGVLALLAFRRLRHA